MYDPYSGKWKNAYGRPQPRRLNECAWCLIFILLGLGMLLGASLAIVGLPASTTPSPTQEVLMDTPLIILSETPTPIPSTRRPNTATPTARPLVFETPSLTPSQTPSLTPRPTQTPSAEERFQFFARAANLPASIGLEAVSCTPMSSRFTLSFNHPADDLSYLEIILETQGIDSAFSQIIPSIPNSMTVQTGLTIGLNEEDALSSAVFNLNTPIMGETFVRAFADLMTSLKPQDITRLSLTWLETKGQAPIFFEIRATGGVELGLLWAREASSPLDEDERLKFRIC